MRPLALAEIIPLARYAPVRSAYRERVIAHKRARRVALGESATLLFEDRETLRFQVQEMLWVERIEDSARVQAELDVYNELMPGPDELSATLFVEITESAEIRPTLQKLVGLDRHVELVLGEAPDELVVPAGFDTRQLEEERISAVQYLRFALAGGAQARFSEAGERARLRSTHPRYPRESEIPPAVRASLVAALAREPEPLLRHADAPEPPAAGDVLFTTGRVRARRAPSVAGAAHVIVEPLAAPAAADPGLEAELLGAARRAAAELGGRCRLETELAGGAALYWHVYAEGD